MTSTIKVDNINKVSDDSNIIKKCGSTTTVGSGSGQTIVVDGATVTLGRCGGAVNLAPGATQSGFGDPASAVLFCTTAKTSPFTAASKVGYFVNTSGGAITVTLPSSPSAGDIVAFKDYGGTWNTACKAVTLCRNGSLINGGGSNATLATQNQAITLLYVDGTKGWQDIQDSTAGVTGNTIYDVEYLVVAGAGGGSGPPAYGGGGGGAGGYRTATGFSVGSNCGPYTVTVGAGGAGASLTGCNGANSVFSTITSAGGGGAGGSPGGVNGGIGNDGGSGGGVAYGSGGSGNTPPVSPPQGNDGGDGSALSANVRSGGGGGAAAVGESGPGQPTPNQGGDGGIGATTAIFGSAPQAPTYGTPGPAPGRYFAGGGAARGGAPNAGANGTPGAGGAGGGATPSGSSGTANTGGGGAGNRLSAGGAGGSGIVIIKHATSDASPAVSGGNVVLTCGSNTIRVFTSSGTFTA